MSRGPLPPPRLPAGAPPQSAPLFNPEESGDSHRARMPTLPIVPTPEVDWEPVRDPLRLDTPGEIDTADMKRPAPEDYRRPVTESGLGTLERASGLGQPAAAPPASGGRAGPVEPSPGSKSYPSTSGERDVVRGSAPPPADSMPLGYIVASAFFLAVAVVGFGLWLAFEVISL